MHGNRTKLMPHRKGNWEVALDPLWACWACHTETVLTSALHRWDLSLVHSTQCCFRSFEFHFPSQQLGRTRRDLPSPESTLVIYLWERVGGVKPLREPLGWDKPGCLELALCSPCLVANSRPSTLPRNLLLLLPLITAAMDEWNA